MYGKNSIWPMASLLMLWGRGVVFWPGSCWMSWAKFGVDSKRAWGNRFTLVPFFFLAARVVARKQRGRRGVLSLVAGRPRPGAVRVEPSPGTLSLRVSTRSNTEYLVHVARLSAIDNRSPTLPTWSCTRCILYVSASMFQASLIDRVSLIVGISCTSNRGEYPHPLVCLPVPFKKDFALRSHYMNPPKRTVKWVELCC
ncbi:hypothetical protein F5X99DRAFT_337423 [Biscogniauxia marginata]|nr:hypothetical protein F5X99DRAFT_337423 [Biscogniauxia marginata]